jgi:hypothetical protein
MKLALRRSIQISLLFAGLCATASAATDPPPCSTEKVNHEDCTFTFNRWYPVTFPTIQMSQGKQIIVKLKNQLPFESVTLDSTGTTLLPGSDQGAALLTAVIPNLKGLVFTTAIKPGAAPGLAGKPATAPPPASPAENQVIPELAQLQQMLQDASGTIDFAFTHAQVVYAQLSQALSPLPIPGTNSAAQVPPLPADPHTPNPWQPASYPIWRAYLLCELVGGGDCAIAKSPSFNNVLGQISILQSGLPPATSNLLFDQHVFDFLAQKASNDIQSIPAGSRQPYLDAMTVYAAQENRLVSIIASLGTSLPAVQKDFQTYYQNIDLTLTNPVPNNLDNDGTLILGPITDPRSSTGSSYPHFLGKQVTFSVNVVNQISTSRASVITPQAKTSIATITVLYADPRFEASAGVLLNFVHNRTFGYQTITTPAPGTSQTVGEMQIFETATRPSFVPFVAGNIRLGNDFVFPAQGRRAAFYATGWVGINVNNSLPEYGAGPTFAWRSLMFSVLYDRTHDTRLAPGSYVGQIVCSPSPPAGSSLPSCTPAPAALTSTTFATNAFAFGLSVRIPTTFAAGAGGVSR